MQAKRIDDGNRTDIQRKYIDHILGSLDFMEIKDKLRDYLEIEKDRESNRSLEAEITHEAPDILVDNWEDFDDPATLTQEEPHHA
jgi:hypothetical protein